jgi:uncharacterized protein YggE
MSGEPTGITVTGVGRAATPPDLAFVDLGIRVAGRTVAEARQAGAAAAERVLEAVRSSGLAAEDIQTAAFSIAPRYRHTPAGESHVDGYEVNNAVTLRVRDLAAVGGLVDAAAAAGGDDAVVHGIRFALEDDRSPLARAREAAMADAAARAAQLAAAAGARLGAVLAIEEAGQGGIHVKLAREAMLSADSGTPIEGGSAQVTVAVTVRYAIEAT